MTKYFVRIDRQTQGPFTLTELMQHDIRPSTYVWAKGMPDWQRAEDVPDICRAMRYMLAGLPIPESEVDMNQPNRQSVSTTDPNGGAPQPFGFRSFPEPSQNIDYDIKPQGVSIFMAIILTLLFFPITGLITIWYAYRFKVLWGKSEQDNITSTDRHNLRVQAYKKARMYRMMSLITVFITLIMIGVMMALRS